ncbi:deaminase domain-containing protein [Paenibacillus sp. GCM10027627]|uniref:deaminase domain-containing protein n=1 Tax=unclassified Paenibacillus TaxID=185978 RepID=UPI003645B323
MANIYVDISRVRQGQAGLDRSVLKSSSITSGIRSTYVDSAIASRRNIGSRLYQATNKMHELHSKLREVQSFVKYGIEQYELTEAAIERRAHFSSGNPLAPPSDRWKATPRPGAKLTPQQIAGFGVMGKVTFTSLQWYAERIGQVQAVQAVSAQPGKGDKSNEKPGWKYFNDIFWTEGWKAIKNEGKAAVDGFVETIDSFKGIFVDMFDAHRERAIKSDDSFGDFLNHMTLGIPYGFYQGMVERNNKKNESVYHFANYLSSGLLGVIDGALFPKDPGSKEHVGNVMGFAGLFIPALKVPKVNAPDVPPHKKVGEVTITSRKLEEVSDAALINKVKEMKKNLPSKLRGKYNFGYAEVNIEGLNKKDYYAHSGISKMEDIEDSTARGKIQDISIEPLINDKVFTTLKVNKENIVDGDGAWDRSKDTEFKILNEIATSLGNKRDAVGKITLYTDLDCCPSCNEVIRQFKETYQNIEIEVIYKTKGGGN